MSYQVIARKFRPATFDELVGQEPVVKALKNAIELGRIAHAYVFSGPRGTGKTTTARILAKMLNCTGGPTVTPCLKCASCVEIAAAGSIDVIEIDGASNRGINEIRDLKEKISYRPGRDRFKIYIIDEVHMLTTEAFNALLKTLEEPPAHVKFIFATTEAHKIPRTILSRCQRYTFRLLPPRQVEQHLQRILESEGIPFDETALRVIVNETEGSVRDAQSLLEQAISASGGSLTADAVREILGLSDRSDLLALLEAVRGGDAGAILDILERTASYGGDIGKLGLSLLKLLRDLTTASLGLSHDSWRVLTRQDEAFVLRLVQGTDFDYWYRLYRLWTRAVDEIQRSVLPRETAEIALLRLARTPATLDLAELVEAVNALKRTAPEPTGAPAARSEASAPQPPETPRAPTQAEPSSVAAPAPRPLPSRFPSPRPAAPVPPAPMPRAPAPAPAEARFERMPWEVPLAAPPKPVVAPPTPAPAPQPVAAPSSLTLEPSSPEPDPESLAPEADEPGLFEASEAEVAPAPLLPEIPNPGESPDASPPPEASRLELTTDAFPRVLDRLANESQAVLRGVLPLVAELQLVALQGATVVLGIPLSSPHALLADKLRAKRDDIQNALKRITGRDVVVDWTEIRPPAREVPEVVPEKERVRRDVEQLPIFQQLKHEFGATLRLGDDRR